MAHSKLYKTKSTAGVSHLFSSITLAPKPNYRHGRTEAQVLVMKTDNTSVELVDGWSIFKDALVDAHSVTLTIPINECHSSPRTLLICKGHVRVRVLLF